MKRITLPKIRHALETMQHEVTIDPAVAGPARRAVERMLAIRAEATMTVPPLPRLMHRAQVRAALLEDLGRAGDITTDAIVPATARRDRAGRPPGRRRRGTRPAPLAFPLIDPAIEIEIARRHRLAPGDTVATIAGPARGMLTAERVALNFLWPSLRRRHGDAALVEAVAATRRGSLHAQDDARPARVQKYAVRVGGGVNHRFGLDDAVLIKDNHVAAAGGIRAAIERARAHAAIW